MSAIWQDRYRNYRPRTGIIVLLIGLSIACILVTCNRPKCRLLSLLVKQPTTTALFLTCCVSVVQNSKLRNAFVDSFGWADLRRILIRITCQKAELRLRKRQCRCYNMASDEKTDHRSNEKALRGDANTARWLS